MNAYITKFEKLEVLYVVESKNVRNLVLRISTYDDVSFLIKMRRYVNPDTYRITDTSKAVILNPAFYHAELKDILLFLNIENPVKIYNLMKQELPKAKKDIDFIFSRLSQVDFQKAVAKIFDDYPILEFEHFIKPFIIYNMFKDEYELTVFIIKQEATKSVEAEVTYPFVKRNKYSIVLIDMYGEKTPLPSGYIKKLLLQKKLK